MAEGSLRGATSQQPTISGQSPHITEGKADPNNQYSPKVLDSLSQTPIYDHMVIQNDKIGDVIRTCIKERRLFTE